VNPEEKTEDDFPTDGDQQEDSRNESTPGLDQPGEGQVRAAPEVEEEESSDGGPAPPPEESDRRGRGRARPEGSKLKSILEAMIFVSEQPISLERMAGVLTDCTRKDLKEVLNELEQEYEERGGALEIVQVANGYQFRTRAEFAPWIGKMRQQRFARLSRAALETLAIVAYRQPVTRAEAEAIRGVDSGAVLGTLLERRLLRILGRKEVPGRPILYGTTAEFLELFGLRNLKDLPTLREIKDMVDTAQEGAEGEEEKTLEDQPVAEPEGQDSVPSADEDASESEEEEEGEPEAETEAAFEDEWEEEEPITEDDLSPRELDEILKSTKTRLELYEADLQAEEEGGQKESAEGSDDNKKPGEDETPGQG
jgi:segregation and condensation protein B